MTFICKDFCLRHSPDFFMKNCKINKTGIDVLYCRACNIFLKIKAAFSRIDLFKRFAEQNHCDCCGCPLRTNVRTRRQKERYKNLFKKLIKKYRPRNQLLVLRNSYKKCKCGCGCEIPYINKKGESIDFKHGHRITKTLDRSCLYCGSSKTQIRKNTNTPRWFNTEEQKNAVICFNCYSKKCRLLKKKILHSHQQERFEVVPLSSSHLPK